MTLPGLDLLTPIVRDKSISSRLTVTTPCSPRICLLVSMRYSLFLHSSTDQPDHSHRSTRRSWLEFWKIFWLGNWHPLLPQTSASCTKLTKPSKSPTRIRFLVLCAFLKMARRIKSIFSSLSMVSVSIQGVFSMHVFVFPSIYAFQLLGLFRNRRVFLCTRFCWCWDHDIPLWSSGHWSLRETCRLIQVGIFA